MLKENFNKLFNSFTKIVEKLSEVKYFLALRDGMLGILPIIIVGSFFLLLGSLDKFMSSLSKFPNISAILSQFMEFYRLTMGCISLFLAFTTGYYMGKYSKISQISNGVLTLASFLLGCKLSFGVIDGKNTIVLNIKQLGADGLFMAILLSFIVSEAHLHIYNLSQKIFKKNTLSATYQQKGIPQTVTQALNSLLPYFTILPLIWLIAKFINIQSFLIEFFKPLEKLGDSIGLVIIVNIVLHLMNFAGIHGISIINAVLFAMWQKFLLANAEAVAHNTNLPFVTAYPFFQWFIWIGGAGNTLALTFILLISRVKHLRNIGKVAIIPSLFNINEPVLFGLPIVANPVFLIPFILSPTICGIITYLAICTGLVGRPWIEAPWIFPFVLGAYLSTADVKAIILALLNFIISGIIYYPFLKIYEKQLSDNSL